MLISRQILFSFILLFGYSATACSQTEGETDSDVIIAETPDSLGSDSAKPESFGSDGEAPESHGSDSEHAAAEMKGKALAAVIQKLDEDAVVAGNRVVFKIAEREMMMVYDETANRMRVISPIIDASAVPAEVQERMLQANFDAVLDTRYAVGNDIVWAVFLHPLSTLTEDDFVSALAQTVTAAETFGTTYTSGAIVFGGGDSSSIHEDLLEELKKAQKARSDI